MMELDDLNKNPSMKMILLVIEKLHSEITPPPAEMAKNDAAMPSWMRDIHSKLTNPSKCLYLFIFLLFLNAYRPLSSSQLTVVFRMVFRLSPQRSAVPGQDCNQYARSIRDVCWLLDTASDASCNGRRVLWRTHELLCSGFVRLGCCLG